MNDQEKNEFAGVKTELALFQINQLKKNSELEGRLKELETANEKYLILAGLEEKKFDILDRQVQELKTQIKTLQDLMARINNLEEDINYLPPAILKKPIKPKSFWDKLLKR